MSGSVFGNIMPMMEKSLDFLWAKQQTTMNNIANGDTPGYKAKYVSFENEFRSRLVAANRGNSKDVRAAIGQSHHFLHETRNESARADGNNVNVDIESVELTRAALQYQYALNSFNNDFSRLRAVIKGQ